ncbi:MAG: hypothetical protein ABII09_06540 [Planctomycetota bacterium]
MSKFPINRLSIAACIVSLAGLVWAISPFEQKQLDNFKVSTLKDLPGVAVAVKVARDDPNTLRLLDEQDLQRDVEFTLQTSGIEVLRPTPEVGLYIVLVNVVSTGRDTLTCAIHVQSSLMQIVSLARDPSIRTEAKTWPALSEARFGVVPLGMAKRMISQAVKDQAAEFAEDYKAANPKVGTH